MIKKYNLALIPISSGNEVVRLAKKLSHIADAYILGENSLPHVTLYHFEADENDVDSIWQKVCNSLGKMTINLVFDRFSCITFNNSIFWVSLLPNHCDVLHIMHESVANILLLPSKKMFDPHMTLINTKNIEYKKEVDKLAYSYETIKDQFVLSLGVSDDIGQLKKVINSIS